MANKKALRKRKLRRRKRIMMAVMIAIIIILAAVLAWIIAMALGRDAAVQEVVPTASPTIEATLPPVVPATQQPTAMPQPTDTPEPVPQIPINLYAPDGDGVRHRLVEYVSKWTRGKDIDCFEALVSDESTLRGKNFYEICKAAWGTLPDPYAMRIGYTLRYTLMDGSEISMVIRSPGDITNTQYVECYLYDDVHQAGGFYTHLSEAGMKDDTLMTSIKLTCGDKIEQVQEIYLGVFLYDSEDQFDEQGNYIGAWYSEIPVRRKT